MEVMLQGDIYFTFTIETGNVRHSQKSPKRWEAISFITNDFSFKEHSFAMCENVFILTHLLSHFLQTYRQIIVINNVLKGAECTFYPNLKTVNLLLFY